MFIDMWRYVRIEIVPTDLYDKENQDYDSHNLNKLANITSFLRKTNFKFIALSNFLVLVIINLINALISIFIAYDSTLGVQLRLPGTGSGGLLPIIISPFIYGLLTISPVLATCSLIINYRGIHKFTREQLERVLEQVPTNIRINIIENLKALNEKLKDQLKIE
jgi:hypothetical protein